MLRMYTCLHSVVVGYNKGIYMCSSHPRLFKDTLHKSYRRMIDSIDVIQGQPAVSGGRVFGTVLYEILIVFSDRRPTHTVMHSYERFLELRNKIHEHTELRYINEKFPRQLKRNKFGIPISKHQNDLRCDLLNRWMDVVMRESPLFDYKLMEALSIFLNVPLELLHYAEKVEKFDDSRTTEKHLQLEALIDDARTNLSNNVSVTVRRKQPTATDTHPMFETLIQYDFQKPVYIASRRFGAYRKLFKDLYRGLFDTDHSQTALEQDLLELEGKFPRTYKRSMFGIKLSDADLAARAAGLAYWMNGILTRFRNLDVDRKHMICAFLSLNAPKNAEEDNRNKAILGALNSDSTKYAVSPGILKQPERNKAYSEAHISYTYTGSEAWKSTIPEPETASDNVNVIVAGERPSTVFRKPQSASVDVSEDSNDVGDLETITIDSDDYEAHHKASFGPTSFEYADDYDGSEDEDERDISDSKPSDGFLSEQELRNFVAKKRVYQGGDHDSGRSRVESSECIIT